jgi:hypothetical protein
MYEGHARQYHCLQETGGAHALGKPSLQPPLSSADPTASPTLAAVLLNRRPGTQQSHLAHTLTLAGDAFLCRMPCQEARAAIQE